MLLTFANWIFFIYLSHYSAKISCCGLLQEAQPDSVPSPAAFNQTATVRSSPLTSSLLLKDVTSKQTREIFWTYPTLAMTFDRPSCRSGSAFLYSVVMSPADGLSLGYICSLRFCWCPLRSGSVPWNHDLRLLLPLHAGALLRAEQPLGGRRHASSLGGRRGSGSDAGGRARPGPPRLQTNGRPGRQPERRKAQSHRRLRKRHL